MWRFTVLSLLAIFSPFPALAQAPAPRGAGGKEVTPAERSDAALRDLAADLREARQLLGGNLDRRTRDRIDQLLSRAELQATQIRKDLATPNPRTTTTSPDDFARVLKGLQAEAFDNGKLAFLESLGKKRAFSSEQVRTLLSQFVFDEGRLKAAVLLHPLTADSENFYTVYDTFKFASSKDELRKQLKSK